MKLKTCLSVILLSIATVPDAGANLQGDAALGVIFGDPTGVSWRLRTSDQNSLSGALGFSPYDRFRVHADYLWYAWPFRNQDVGLYYDVGGAVGFGRSDGNGNPLHSSDSESPAFGLRIPVGLTYSIPQSPVEVFLEVAPLLVFVPSTGAGFDGGIGARIHF